MKYQYNTNKIPKEDLMHITIKEHNSKIVTLELNSLSKIINIKKQISEIKRYPIKIQHLFYKHQELLNDKTLNDYHIKKDTTINLVVLHSPGMY